MKLIIYKYPLSSIHNLIASIFNRIFLSDCTVREEPTHWKRPRCRERLRAREEGDRGWDGWMVSLTQWIWIWAKSGRWWRTGKPGVLQSMRSQRVGHCWTIEQHQITREWFHFEKCLPHSWCFPHKNKVLTYSAFFIKLCT